MARRRKIRKRSQSLFRGETTLDKFINQAEQAAAHPWVEHFIRVGFAAKGIVYLVIGSLAALAAAGPSGETTDTNGALTAVGLQPFGQILLSLLAIGLSGYVLWRLIQALLDPEHHDSWSFPRIVQRIGYLMSGMTYAGVALSAVQILLNPRTMGESHQTEDWTAWLLVQPFGAWIVGIGGLWVMGIGCAYLYGGYSANYISEFKSGEMDRQIERWIIRLGQFGIAARGFVFVMIGFFLIQAALQSNANRAEGLGGTLEALAEAPFGSVILGITAFGFIAYAIYMLVAAGYRRFSSPSKN